MTSWTEESWKEMAKRVISGYHDQGIDCLAISLHQSWGYKATPLMVKIKLDGYMIYFPHNEEFQIPPSREWVKCGQSQWQEGCDLRALDG